MDTVSSRSARLNKVILGRVGDTNFSAGLTRDGLLDAFLALYDECNNEALKKDRNIAKFVEKFREAAVEVRHLQVNIADFEVKKTIGRGHFGEVLLVKEKKTDTIYAMKKISKGLTQDKSSEDFYEREREILLKASGPWLTRLQYSFHDAQYLYLVMEFHPGGDMLSLMERNNQPLPETNAQFYLTELILAVNSVHTMGYVHRDIKPDNILLDRTGHIKLADFGSVSRLNENQKVTSKIPVGTPEYIAPEVLTSVNGSCKPYGIKCDWWSVGVVFYEMLFGSTPFSSDTVIATYSNIINFKDSLSIPDGVSEGAVAIIKGLLTDEKNRFGFKDLNNHSYFEGMNWTSIIDGQAPYVPSITSEDDTSHFDEFDPEPSPVSVEPFRPKRDFSGKSLPYVGFTYNPFLSSLPDKMSLAFCISPVGGRNSAGLAISQSRLSQGADLLGLKKELNESQKKFNALLACEAALRGQVATAQGRASSLEKRVLLLENKLHTELSRLQTKDTEIESTRKLLELERRHRVISEEKAVALLHAIQRKYRECEKLTLLKKRLLGDQETEIVESDDDESTLKEEPVTVEQQNVDVKLNGSKGDTIKSETLKNESEVIEKQNLEVQLQVMPEIIKKQQEESKQKLPRVVRVVAVQTDSETSSEVQVQTDDLAVERKEDEQGVALRIELRNVTQKLEESQERYLRAMQEISELKGKLDDDRCESQRLLEDVDNEKKSKEELQTRIQELETELKTTVNDQIKKAELGHSMVQELESSLNTEKRLRKQVEEQLQQRESQWRDKHKCIEEEMQEALSAKNKLECELAELEMKNTEDKEAITHLRQELDILKLGSVADTKRTTCSECETSAARVSQLQEEVKNVRNTLSSQRSKCFDLQRELRVKEHDLKEVKLDLKITSKDLEKSRTLSAEVGELREKCARMQDEHGKCPAREAQLQERMNVLQVQVDTQNQLCREAELKLLQIQEKHVEVVVQKSQLEKDFNLLSKKFDVLMAAFTQGEEQVKAYESLVEQSQKNESGLQTKIRSLELEVEAKLKEMKLMQETFAREKNKHQEQLHQLGQRLEEERRLIADRGEEAASLRAELSRRDQQEAELRKQLDEAEGNTERLALAKIVVEKTVEEADYEIVKIKEEASRHITTLANLKRSNLDLQEGLELREQRIQVLTCEIESLQSDLDIQKVYYETELTKSREQIQQLNKLVLHLQSSMSEKKRKWPFFKNSSSHKADKGVAVAKEDRRSRIRRMDKEMQEMQNKAVEADTPSKISEESSGSSSVCSKGSHALEEVTKGFGLASCAVCRKPSVITKMLTCHDCNTTCHRHCQTELKGDCGYRSETQRRRRTVRHQMTFHIQKGEYGAWVHLPRRRDAGWERRFLSLSRGILYAYETGSLQGQPVTSFELCPTDDVVVVRDASSSGQFIVEIFSPTTDRELRFMVSDLEEKFKWLEVLEGIIQPHMEKQSKVLDIKALDSCILTLEKENLVELRCCYMPLNSRMLLLGAEEGFFGLDVSLQGPGLKKITSDSVHSFTDALDRKILIVVQGKGKSAHWIFVSSVENGDFEMHPLVRMQNCRILSSCGAAVAVATPQAIYVLHWNQQKGDFALHEEVTTPSHPCVSMQLTESLLLYATNSLGTLILDRSKTAGFRENVGVNAFVENVLQKQKEPVTIFAVDQSFLLCFQDFGILLNGKDQKQIKWTQTPQGFAFRQPYLYVSYLNCIEVIEIDCQKNNLRGNWTYVMAKKPQHLGQGSGNNICISTVCGSQLLIHRLDGGQALEVVSFGTDLGNASRISKASSESEFSFTSSVLDVLEGDQLGETRTLDSVGREASM